MKIKLKNIIARELLALLIAALVGGVGFLFGYISHRNHSNELTKMNTLNDSLNKEILSRITNFRKDPVVDSVYKIQMTFFDGYKKIPAKYASDSSNFFFWKNMISSVADSTFNFTYANDDAMNQMEGQYELHSTLEWHRKRFYTSENYYVIKKKLFSSFAQNVQLYNFVAHDKWASYEELRIEQDKVHSQLKKMENEEFTSEDEGFIFGFGPSVILFFGVRYLVYLIRWSIRTWKSV